MKVAEQKEWLLNILKNKDIGSIDEFLAKGGKIDINLNNAKQTILALAVSEDDIELSKVLINKGANVNSLSHSGHPIISSVKSLKMAQLLVESGADLTILSKKGENILHYLISSQNTVLVKYLCQQMGDVYSDEELKSVEPMDETGFWNLIGKHYQKVMQMRHCKQPIL